MTSPLGREGVWRFTAPALESTVPRARHAVRDLLTRQRVPVAEEVAEGLLLIVSELVTNAVQHAALLSPKVTVEVTITTDAVRIAVEDEHPYRPKALRAGEDDIGGRGLWLVKMISEETGGRCDVEDTANGGKAIWAELPLTGPPPGR
ncbi:ATP-binding protein [Streptomyces sp. NPDC003077]|uniref:ATP-binding protein n=1 Tax=Streptomyces sp. NPDC003077 TaxID=3154443 RepID=UPI0033A1D4AB